VLWKLNWFLRDFGYDADLLGQDEIDDKNLDLLACVEWSRLVALS
jgi:hypothetical protein